MTYFMENPSVESGGNKLETLDAIYPHQQTKPQSLCRRKLKIASLFRVRLTHNHFNQIYPKKKKVTEK